MGKAPSAGWIAIAIAAGFRREAPLLAWQRLMICERM